MSINNSLFAEDFGKIDIATKSLFQKHFEEFPYNEEQLIFINSPLHNCKLLGIPGGGKTQSILGKIFHHFAVEDFTQSNHYMLLTFSRKTSVEFFHKGIQIFQNSFKTEDIENFFNIKNIRTIHSFAGRINQEYQMDGVESSQDTVIISAMFHLEKDVDVDVENEKWKNIDEMKDLKVIFVDEAQDISKLQYDFLLMIQKKLGIPIIMIGDPNQNIYQFQKGNDYYLIHHEGTTFHLIKNYRSVQSIINMVNFFRPWTSLTPMMICGKEYTEEENNRKPIIFTGSVVQIIDNIIEKIKKSPFPRENIAIIGPVKKSKPIMDTYKNIGLSLFISKLKENNILYKKQYEETNDEVLTMNEIETSTNREEGYINLYTVHGAKGMEFDQVFLVNFHTYTFGMMPTEEKYKEFKYLWYVGLSRARYFLDIYVDEKKVPWYDLKYCPNNYYRVENRCLQFSRKIEFKQEIEPEYFDVKRLFQNKNYIDEEALYQFERYFPYKIRKEVMWESVPIRNMKEYQKLYNIYLHFVFIYYYSLKRRKIPDFFCKLRMIFESMMFIPKRYVNGMKEMKLRYPNLGREPLQFQTLYENKNKMKQSEELVFNYIYNNLRNSVGTDDGLIMGRYLLLYLENEVMKFPKDVLDESMLYLELCLKSGEETEMRIQLDHLFKLSLFIYQLEEENGQLWDIDFQEEMNDLYVIAERVKEYAMNEKNDRYVFFQQIEHMYLPICGEIDALFIENNKKKIISMRFQKNLMKKQMYEIFLYCNMVDVGWRDIEVEIWNFYNGEKIKVVMEWDKLSPFLYYRILSTILKKKLNNMIFVYDVEMVGETEESMDLVQAQFEDYVSGEVVTSNYYMPDNVENIIGYYNREILMTAGRAKVIDLLREDVQGIFDICERPIFVSHNAEMYDQYLLKRHGMFQKEEEFRVIDTRRLLKYYSRSEVADGELVDFYESIFGEALDETKCGEQIKMLRNLLRYFGIEREIILNLT